MRQHLEPVLLGAGFVFNEVAVGAGPVAASLRHGSAMGRLTRLLRRRNAGNASATAITTTSVLYEADAQEFAAAYPRSQERPEAPDCIDLQGEDLDLGDAAGVVNDPSRSLEERVVALTGR